VGWFGVHIFWVGIVVGWVYFNLFVVRGRILSCLTHARLEVKGSGLATLLRRRMLVSVGIRLSEIIVAEEVREYRAAVVCH
jgi:hypothetical protein